VSDQVNLTSQPGWMTGLAGMAVFLGESGVGIDSNIESHRDKVLARILERILETINDGFSYPTLATGLTGIVWSFRYLGERGIIDCDEAHVLDELIPFIRRCVDHELDKGNLDALHGATGLGIVLSQYDAGADCFRSMYSSIEDDIDLGLAHGLASQIVYYSETCTKSKRIPDVGQDLLASSLSTLLSHADLKQKNGSVFPTRIHEGIPQYPSRLAWCYGDVGIAMGLLRYTQGCKGLPRTGSGVAKLQSSEIFDFAVEVLVLAAGRRDSLNTRIVDPYFCHGTSGLAYMFYKAWHLSNNDKLKEAAQYWTKETIRFLETTHPIGKVYKTEGVTFGDGSLLNGLSGIGLALLAIERGVLPGWEKGLLM